MARRFAALGAISAALAIGAMPLWFAGAGLRAYFTNDDVMNLYGYWSKPWRDLLVANLAWYSPSYRPLGGLFYRGLFAAFGFDPFPFRVASFALILINLGLLYAVARELAGSREAGLLAALAGCYHAHFVDLYYNTGTIYDLLCYSFYAGALLFYIRVRRQNRQLRRREVIALAALYVCALNAKEMAVTLPLALLVYEGIYHRPVLRPRAAARWLLRGVWPLWLLAALTVPYVLSKLSHASAFSGVPDYRLHISLARYIGTYAYYLDGMFYQPAGWFTPARTLLLFAAMFAAAALSRRKALWFSFLFVLSSVLPVVFIQPRGTVFVLYVSFLGWSLYGAALLVSVRGRLVGAGFGASAATVAGAIAALFLIHQVHTPRQNPDTTLRSTNDQFHAMLPTLPEHSRILLLDDPFPAGDWTPMFLVRLSYGDPTIQVDRWNGRQPDPRQMAGYTAVLRYDSKVWTRLTGGPLPPSARVPGTTSDRGDRGARSPSGR